MAAENLAALADSLSQTFATGFARQYARTTETLKVIRVIRGNGKNVAWDVELDGATAAAHADGSPVDDSEFSYDPMVPATLPWGLYRSAFSVTDTEIDAAYSSIGNVEEVINIFQERMEGAFSKLAQVVNRDVISGTGTDGSGNPTIVGLLGGALDNSGTYAGVARGSYPDWASNVLTGGGVPRPLSIDLMDHMEQNIYTASRLKPNAIMTSPGVVRRYKGLFESSRRVVTDGGTPVRYGAGTSVLDYNTAPIIRDADMPTGKMLWLNTDWLELVQLPSREMNDYVRSIDMQLKESDGANPRPLPLICKVSPLPKLGDAVRMQVSIKLQLRVRRPNAMGQIKDLSES